LGNKTDYTAWGGEYLTMSVSEHYIPPNTTKSDEFLRIWKWLERSRGTMPTFNREPGVEVNPEAINQDN
jgi:hypothetical protein